MSLPTRFEPLIRPLFQTYARTRRGMTLGVRGMVLDGDGRVLLVRHTYVKGWHMPGGGVERGETAETAMARELVEEAGVRLTAPPVLVSIHSADATFRGDHILLYRIEAWTPCPPTSRGEIAEIGWFAADALPDGTTDGTRGRIAEALAGAPRQPLW
ncbi:MAG TPA: NUDIX domain-containing protein [Caulobacteraceae bacterium]|jgi:8-oxo-dGTP pyrophosphatase MutT (NUDIX family)|nr:NUDIX domain-containing protein [Caulobacteraceae bacterium]